MRAIRSACYAWPQVCSYSPSQNTSGWSSCCHTIGKLSKQQRLSLILYRQPLQLIGRLFAPLVTALKQLSPMQADLAAFIALYDTPNDSTDGSDSQPVMLQLTTGLMLYKGVICASNQAPI